jgi:hypothetical protein
MKKGNHFINTGVVTLTVTALISCGGSGSGSDSSSAPAPAPVVEPVGLTLEQVVSEFNASGALNLSESVSGNISYGSGNDLVSKNFSFSVENAYGAKVCVSYSGQDSDVVQSNIFKFSDLGCGYELSLGGKADLNIVLNDFNEYSAKASINSQSVGRYDIYTGSEVESVFKIKNGEVLTCSDSVSGTDSYVVSRLDAVSGDTSVSVLPGVYADESFAGESFSVSCDVTDANGGVESFSDIAKFDASISTDIIVDRLAAGANSKIIARNIQTYLVKNIGDNIIVSVCDGVLENEHGTRACVEVGSAEDSVSTDDIIVNDQGIDYSISGVNSMNFSEAVTGLVSRLGTPVLKQHKNFSITSLYDGYTPGTFEVKNVVLLDSICKINPTQISDTGFRVIGFVGSDVDELGFNFYTIEQPFSDFTGVESRYLDENGNYNFGTFDCRLGGPSINAVFSLSGNVNDDLNP